MGLGQGPATHGAYGGYRELSDKQKRSPDGLYSQSIRASGVSVRLDAFFGYIGDDSREPWGATFVVVGKPYFRYEGFTVTPMYLALRRRAELYSSVGPQRVLQIRHKRGNRLANQLGLTWDYQFDRGPVCQFDDAALVERDNCRGAGFDQSAHPRLRFEAEPAVANKFPNEQPASGEGRHLKNQTDGSSCWVERTENLAEHSANEADGDKSRAGQEASRQCYGHQVQQAHRYVGSAAPARRQRTTS